MEVEFAIFERWLLPVNSLCVLKRLQNILEQNWTNAIMNLKEEQLNRARACILILYDQAMMDWDVRKAWEKARDALNPVLIAEKLGKPFGG